jgi:LPXTG-site transpeptidase (sortase) family protein
MLNPLFPNENDEDADKQGYTPAHQLNSALRHGKTIEPLHDDLNPAANLIRTKIANLYAQEPTAKQELAEVKATAHLSKHQKFMRDLSTSGKGLAEIQTEWHVYYASLSDKEKHEVWQEFYDTNRRDKKAEEQASTLPEHKQPEHEPVAEHKLEYEAMVEPDKGKTAVVSVHEHEPLKEPRKHADDRSAVEIKRDIRKHASSRGKLRAKHHLQSLLFGLGIGTLVVIITLFSFFNEYIIAPFIQPSREVGATPLIIGTDSVAPTATPEVIIPKINVEIPLVGFDLNSTDENQVENDLEDGVVHYPTTVLPGQKGNTAFFGHSSNNIFNPGHYKFAFALLHDLVPGDTFYLTYNDTVYAYQVYDKQIVSPNDVAVLDNVPGKVATATLITCDPPGTSLNRLVVWGEQVSPDPNVNGNGNNTSTSISSSTQLPNNGPSLWSRMIHAISSWF